MKSNIIFYIAFIGVQLLNTCIAKSQNLDSVFFHNPDSIISFHDYETIPSFPGGLDSLESFLAENLKYPKTAKNDSIQGVVHVKFFVRTDGYIEDITIEKGVRSDLDSAAVNAIKGMPKWNEGTIRVPFKLPIVFQLNK